LIKNGSPIRAALSDIVPAMPLTAVLMGDPFLGRRELVAQHKPERAPYDPCEWQRALSVCLAKSSGWVGCDRPSHVRLTPRPFLS
jgi:hypothetical protein